MTELSPTAIRAHALVAVRQQHDQPGLPHPLVLAGGDELVDDALRGPQSEVIRAIDSIRGD